MASQEALLETNCPDLSLINRGKVRDIYAVPDDESTLLFVATDRVSAFDVVMKNGIPGKGKLLTKLSEFWFDILPVENHLVTTKIEQMPQSVQKYKDQLDGRCMLVRKCQVLKVEAIVRGYLTGSAYSEYKEKGTVHGIDTIPKDLPESSKFPQPLFTPSTKAEIGDHDENVSPSELPNLLPRPELADTVVKMALDIYNNAAEHAQKSGLILADTKFEFGLLSLPDGSDKVILVDEVLTPDSSRFWLADQWQPGKRMTGLDKQFFREWLKGKDSNWDGKTALEIPQNVVTATWDTYKEAYKRITGKEFA